ncbi:secretion system effector C (SseC) like family protein, partial [Vibrio parahaemolyticus 861]
WQKLRTWVLKLRQPQPKRFATALKRLTLRLT